MPLPALSVTQFLVLTALAKEPSHGYTLQTQIPGDSSGIYLKPQSIYKTLKLLQARGWVEETDGQASDGPTRTTYRISPHGRRVLRSEAYTFKELGRIALDRTS